VHAFSSKYQPVSPYRETGFFILDKEVRGKLNRLLDEAEGEQGFLLGKHTKKANCPKGQDAKSLA